MHIDNSKIVILGAAGNLGTALQALIPHATAWDRSDINATDFTELKNRLQQLQPEVIINCIAYNNVDGAEENKAAAELLNTTLPKQLAEISNELNALFVHISTGYIFDGEADSYAENAPGKPVSIYGKTKSEGERAASLAKKHYIIRTNVLFGTPGSSAASKPSFVDIMLRQVAEGKTELKLVSDEINSITYTPDLAKFILSLIETDAPVGIYHGTNHGQASWYEFAREIFSQKNIPMTLIPVSSSDFVRPAIRPKRIVLENTKTSILRPWQEALKEYLQEK